MTDKNLIYETDESVGIIRVNRPEVRNVFNWETWMEFEDALKQLHSDPNLRVGIIIGVGEEAFVGGADLRMLKERTPQDAVSASKKANEILLFMESMDEPMIAAINGWALGGGVRDCLGLRHKDCQRESTDRSDRGASGHHARLWRECPFDAVDWSWPSEGDDLYREDR